MATISTSVTGPIVLSGTNNPLTITSTGVVTATAAAADAIDGASGSTWIVVNSGTVSSLSGFGVALGSQGTITNSGLIKGARAIRFTGGIGTVANYGTIIGTAGDVIGMFAGGSISNAAGGTIASQATVGASIYIGGAAGTVTNAGKITGIDYAIDLTKGGTVTNSVGGILSAARGVHIQGAAGTVINSGTITGTTSLGVRLAAGGTVTNNAGGSISGPLGVVVYAAAGTVTNLGTISGTTHAVQLNGAGANRVVVGASGVFIGDIAGSTATGATNTLELAGGTDSLSGFTAAGAGTMTGNGKSWAIKNFTTVAVDAGASLTFTGANTVATILDNGTIDLTGALTVTAAIDSTSTGVFQLDGKSLEVAAAAGANTQISFLGASQLTIDNAASFGLNVGTGTYTGPLLENFGSDDKIDLKGFSLTGVALNYNAATGVLQIANGAGKTASLAFQTSSLAGGTFQAVTDASTGTFIQLGAASGVTMNLANDTGASATDRITSNAALTGTGAANAVVTLTEGAATLGTTTANAAGAWSFTPASLAQGAHTIVATETAGSASLAFTYDTAAPAVTEALVSDTGAPGDGITANGALTGTGDPNAVVTLKEGAATLGTATANAAGVWTFTPASLAQGAHTIVASETDAAGNTGTASLTFTYDSQAPVVTEALVSDTGASASDKITANGALTGTGDPNAVVTLTEGAATLGTATANAAGVWTFTPASLAQGAHTIVASETDAAGNIGSVSLTFTYDSQAPVVTEALVSDTGASASDKITANGALSGTGDPNAVVTLTEGTATLGTATANAAGVWSFTPASLAQGAHTIVASETDAAGNIGSVSLAFTYDTVAPVVTEALADDTGTPGDGVTADPALSGTGDPNAIVTLTEGATTLGTAAANAAGAWTFSPSGLTQGAHTIVASETDAAGNTGTASLTFTFQSATSAVTEALANDTGSVGDGITADPSLKGTADANAVVTLTEGAATLGTATADASGAWTFSPNGLSQGAHTIVASETDSGGNIISASLTFTYDTVAPTVTEALANDTGNPADGITSNSALTGTGDPNALVTLTEGTATLGTATANAAGTWTFSPSGLTQGAHTIVASETDAAGNIGSVSLTFTYDTQAPVVTETLVSDTGASATDKITANAALTGAGDPNAVVTLTEGAATLGTATANAAGTWTFSPSGLTQGAHTIVASETDAAGNTGTASLAFTYDTQAPVVTEALVSDTGASTSDKITANAALSGTGDPNAVVTLTEGAATLGTATANAAGVWTFTPASLAQGAHTLTASETDAAGNTGTASLTFTYDTVAPVVTETLVSDTGTPGDGITSNSALTGTGDPNAVVTLKEGATTLGTATANAAGTWTFSPAGLTQGAHTLTASETDAAGNTGTASLTFTYDTVAPAVTETLVSDTGTPGDGITSNSALTGTGDPNAVVTLKEGATTLGTATANAAGTWTFSPAGLTQGAHTIVASETDAAGNTGSAALTFTNDTVAPAVTETLVSDTGSSASDKITANAALTGTGDPNAVVTLKEGASTLGTATANAAGVWTFTPSSLTQGAHTITASETDIAGNTGTASLTFTYDTVAPVVTEALANDTGTPGDGITADPTLSGTGDPNTVVTLKEGVTTLGTVTANAAGAWTFLPSGLTQGAHTIVASETDAAGNTGSTSLTFTLSGTVASGGTISTSVTGPIALIGALNPLTITSTGTVTSTAAAANGINGTSGTVWTIVNNGTVKSSSGTGVALAGAGSITSSGTVTGISALALRGGGTVSNSGSLAGSGGVGSGSGNGSGVFMSGAAGTVTNSGIVTGGAYGVGLDAGGKVTNTGTIIGGEDGVRFFGAAGTLTNSGTIISTVDDGLGFFAGGTVTNNAGGSISNQGTKGAGIYITGGTTLAVTNAGNISGIDYAIFLAKGGSTANNAGGYISSHRGVNIQGGVGTVTNSGTIKGTTTFGIRLAAGGQVTNAAGATISGPLGIGVYSAVGTITNSGTISGTTHAITFSGTGANRLAVGATSVIIGDVVGSTAAGATNTLELAGGSGTLSGLTGGAGSVNENTKTWAFKNFNTVVADTGANWTLSGKNTVAALTNNGSLTIAGSGSLAVTSAINPASAGVIVMGAGATLEVAAVLGTSTQIGFLSSDSLIIDNAASFGINVGNTTYAGPLLQGFVAGDVIDIKAFAATSLTSSFDATSGILQIANGTAKASLAFQTSSLGAGSFHLATDGSTGIFVTHS